MNDLSSLPTIRLRIPCTSEFEFQERYAARYTADGVFVPSGNLRPVGTHVHLIVELKGITARLSGDAVVCAHTQFAGRDGMRLRLLELDPDSIPLHVVAVEPGPTPASLAAPPATLAEVPIQAAAPPSLPPPLRPMQPIDLGNALFGEEIVTDDEVAARPLEVRIQPVTLKVREATPPSIPPQAETGHAETPREDRAPRLPELAHFGSEETGEELGWLSRTRNRLALAAGVVVLGAGLLIGWNASRQTGGAVANAVEADIQLADTRILEGWLTGKQGDSALDHLLAAKKQSPKNRRVQNRMRLLADKLEKLGILAFSRGYLDEAAAHLGAAAQADPASKSIAQRLAEVRERKASPEVVVPAR